MAFSFLIASSKKITTNKNRHPNETALATDANSSNLDLTNQYWYNPENVKTKIQKK